MIKSIPFFCEDTVLEGFQSSFVFLLWSKNYEIKNKFYLDSVIFKVEVNVKFSDSVFFNIGLHGGLLVESVEL